MGTRLTRQLASAASGLTGDYRVPEQGFYQIYNAINVTNQAIGAGGAINSANIFAPNQRGIQVTATLTVNSGTPSLDFRYVPYNGSIGTGTSINLLAAASTNGTYMIQAYPGQVELTSGLRVVKNIFCGGVFFFQLASTNAVNVTFTAHIMLLP